MPRRKKSALGRAGRWIVLLAILVAAGLAAKNWLDENPQHNPWAPLDLRDSRGLTTAMKLGALSGNSEECRAVLDRSEVSYTALEPMGEGACRREDNVLLGQTTLVPADPQMSCPVAAGLTLWLDQDVTPLARDMLGSDVARIEQLGTYNCRRIGGGDEGRYSQHATANAIDIAAFVLADGRRISVLEDWPGEGPEAQFLRAARDAACESFGTVLSPAFNAAHADHFHLDQGRNPAAGYCR